MEEELLDLLGPWIVLGLLFGFMLLHCLWCRLTVSKEVITVTDKGTIVKTFGSGENMNTVSQYMIYTSDGQAIKNTNSLWFWKFHSDELQGKLKKGKKYRIKTWGVRVAWLGMYKHIVSATEVKPVKRKTQKKSK